MPKRKKHYVATRGAIARAAEALLFRTGPPFSQDSAEDTFILNRLLDVLVWLYSESTHLGHRKYESSEYWSEGARAAFDSDKKTYKKMVALEHVKPRAVLVEELAKAKSTPEVQTILDSIITCVVLRAEHTAIKTPKSWRPKEHPEAYWERYGDLKRVDGPRVAERGHLKNANPKA
jgi:hypothetical protein